MNRSWEDVRVCMKCKWAMFAKEQENHICDPERIKLLEHLDLRHDELYGNATRLLRWQVAILLWNVVLFFFVTPWIGIPAVLFCLWLITYTHKHRESVKAQIKVRNETPN